MKGLKIFLIAAGILVLICMLIGGGAIIVQIINEPGKPVQEDTRGKVVADIEDVRSRRNR